MLHLHKCWQADHAVVWQVSWLIADEQHGQKTQKGFLVLDYLGRKGNLRLVSQKPDVASSPSNFTAIVRKYLPQGHLQIAANDEENNLWLAVRSRDDARHWYFHVSRSSPPLLSFIDPAGTALCRMTHKQTFTKAKAWDEKIPDLDQFENILEDLIATMEAPPEKVVEKTEPAPISRIQADAVRRLRRKRKTLQKSYEKIVGLTDPKELPEVIEHARIFSEHLHEVQDGSSYFEWKDMHIPLDETMTPGQNLNRMHKLIKKYQKQKEFAEAEKKKFQGSLAQLDEDLRQLESEPQTLDFIDTKLKHYRVPLTKHDAEAKAKVVRQRKFVGSAYRKFDISPQWTACVGKSADDNDQLTKQAKSNDYWLHVNGVAGTHVVLKCSRSGLKPEEAILKKAMILAIHFSKASGSLCGEVCLSQKMHLKKPRGYPPGKWQVMQADNIFVKYSDDELQAILTTEDRG